MRSRRTTRPAFAAPSVSPSDAPSCRSTSSTWATCSSRLVFTRSASCRVNGTVEQPRHLQASYDRLSPSPPIRRLRTHASTSEASQPTAFTLSCLRRGNSPRRSSRQRVVRDSPVSRTTSGVRRIWSAGCGGPAATPHAASSRALGSPPSARQSPSPAPTRLLLGIAAKLASWVCAPGPYEHGRPNRPRDPEISSSVQ
jgi:hypothetical protein